MHQQHYDTKTALKYHPQMLNLIISSFNFVDALLDEVAAGLHRAHVQGSPSQMGGQELDDVITEPHFGLVFVSPLAAHIPHLRRENNNRKCIEHVSTRQQGRKGKYALLLSSSALPVQIQEEPLVQYSCIRIQQPMNYWIIPAPA